VGIPFDIVKVTACQICYHGKSVMADINNVPRGKDVNDFLTQRFRGMLSWNRETANASRGGKQGVKRS
jgi:hypothetical protein